MGILIEIGFVLLLRFHWAALAGAVVGAAAWFLSGRNPVVGIAAFVLTAVATAVLVHRRARRRQAMGLDTPLRGAFRALQRRLDD
jgi:membrane protein implicated in regulation of membrane protease activity